MEEFNTSGGITLLEEIMCDFKTKYANNTNTVSTMKNNSSISERNGQKEAENQLRKTIRLESIRIFASFANTKVNKKN